MSTVPITYTTVALNSTNCCVLNGEPVPVYLSQETKVNAATNKVIQDAEALLEQLNSYPTQHHATIPVKPLSKGDKVVVRRGPATFVTGFVTNVWGKKAYGYHTMYTVQLCEDNGKRLTHKIAVLDCDIEEANGVERT